MEGFLDFSMCVISCGTLEGIPAGDLGGKSMGQSVGRLDGMPGTTY